MRLEINGGGESAPVLGKLYFRDGGDGKLTPVSAREAERVQPVAQTAFFGVRGFGRRVPEFDKRIMLVIIGGDVHYQLFPIGVAAVELLAAERGKPACAVLVERKRLFLVLARAVDARQTAPDSGKNVRNVY